MATKPLSKFKCTRCDTIPAEDEVNKCTGGHIVCNKCIQFNLICVCGVPASTKIRNPLVNAVTTTRTNCKFKDDGCTWLIAEGDTSNEHISECKYRPYKCIGDRLKIWKCEWVGPQHKLTEHMQIQHRQNGAPYIYYQQSAVDFDATKDVSKINLIAAFNKTFIFTYFAPQQSPVIFFLIFLLGRKSDAEKYMIHFELNDGLRKMKFIENCYNDVVDVFEIFAQHRCIVIPQKLAETYAKNGRLEFRFVIQKREAVEADNALKQKHMRNELVNGRNQYGGGQVPNTAMGRSVSVQNVSNNYHNNRPKRTVGGAQFAPNASQNNRQERKFGNLSHQRR